MSLMWFWGNDTLRRSDCPYHECMAKVEVEDVFMAVKELLDKNAKDQ